MGRATIIAALGALALSACGGDGGSAAPSEAGGGSINTEQATYRGVGIGDDVATMHREFGAQTPAAEGERIVPRSDEGENDYSPTVIQLTPSDSASPAQERAYRFEHVVFLVRQGRIGSVIVSANDAPVDGGRVTIGEDLETAREAYGVRCGIANAGSEYEEFPACSGKLGPERYVWFGGDPIRNVTLAEVPLGGI